MRMKPIAFLVEDSKTIRDNLVPTLEDLVHASVVGYAATEGEAVDWLKANAKWHLVIIDLFLSEGSGLGVLIAVQGRGPAQRAVVLTNYPTKDMRRRCMALGADAVFDKSTELEEFIEYCRAAWPDAAI
jgi:DNA-binding NarL/FixJ family response regulator